MDMRLSPDILHRIKNCIGFDVYDTFVYTPKVFREKDVNGEYVIPKNLWPIFTLKSKDGLEITKMEDNVGFIEYKPDGSNIWHSKTGSMRAQTLGEGVLKIKNLPLEGGAKFLSYTKESMKIVIADNGAEKSFPVADPSEIIRYLKVELQIELQDAINERSTLSEDERRGLEF